MLFQKYIFKHNKWSQRLDFNIVTKIIHHKFYYISRNPSTPIQFIYTMLEEYLNYLTVIKGRWPNTVVEYRTDILMFFSYLKGKRGTQQQKENMTCPLSMRISSAALHAGFRCDPASAATHLHHEPPLFGGWPQNGSVSGRAWKQQNNYGHLCEGKV